MIAVPVQVALVPGSTLLTQVKLLGAATAMIRQSLFTVNTIDACVDDCDGLGVAKTATV